MSGFSSVVSPVPRSVSGTHSRRSINKNVLSELRKKWGEGRFPAEDGLYTEFQRASGSSWSRVDFKKASQAGNSMDKCTEVGNDIGVVP